MKSDFYSRLKPGEEFESELFEMLKNNNKIISIAKNGTEHTHPEFVNLIRQINTEVSKFIRFAPDGVMLFKDSSIIHYDAKASNSIEKDAYEVYIKYKNSGCKIILFVKFKGLIYWQWIEKVNFIDSHKEVAKYTRKFPIDNDGWICPRGHNTWYYGKKMSGTPYKYFDFSSFVIFQHNKNVA